jgi:hypothetical protein
MFHEALTAREAERLARTTRTILVMMFLLFQIEKEPKFVDPQ